MQIVNKKEQRIVPRFWNIFAVLLNILFYNTGFRFVVLFEYRA